MKKTFHYLEVIHRYLGLFLALFFLAIMLSGLLLTFLHYTAPAISTPQMRQTVMVPTPQALAKKLDDLEAKYTGQDISSVRLPYTAHTVYRVAPGLENGKRYSYFDQNTLEEINVSKLDNGFEDFLVSLHTALLRPFGDGRLGRRMVGYIGLLGLIMGILGLFAWWPQRKGFRWSKSVAPKNFSWRELRMSHSSSGIVLAVLVIMFSLTGWAIGDRTSSKAFLTMFDRVQSEPRPSVALKANPDTARKSLGVITQGALSEFPGNQIVEITNVAGSERSMSVSYRMRRPGKDLNAFGDHYVLVDPYSGVSLGAKDGSKLGFGEKIISSSYTIHTGRGTPIWYQIFITLGSIIICVLAITGVASWIQKHRIRLKNKRKRKQAKI